MTGAWAIPRQTEIICIFDAMKQGQSWNQTKGMQHDRYYKPLLLHTVGVKETIMDDLCTGFYSTWLKLIFGSWKFLQLSDFIIIAGVKSRARKMIGHR